MKENYCCEPSDAEIREEAYRLYLASGRVPGRELENWIQAREQLRERGSRSYFVRSNEPELHFPLNADALCVDTPNPFPNLHG
jgi:Protein of unknown function (DUF2934)